MKCYKCSSEIPENTIVCPLCGAEMSQRARSEFQFGGMYSAPKTAYTPMRWFKFLIYFMLFADAITSIANAYGFITGSIYSIISAGEYKAADAYAEYGTVLRIADIAYAVCLVVFAFLAIFTRYRLAGFKKNAPIYLYVTYIFSVVVAFAYSVAENVITGFDYSVIAASLINLAPQLIFIYLNYVYFKKRKHLFAN